IVLLSDLMRSFLRFGGRVPRGRSSGKQGGNPLAAVVLVLWSATLILRPIVSRLLAMAVGRKREFLADATGAQLTRNPLALAAALVKIDLASAHTRSVPRGADHICIAT